MILKKRIFCFLSGKFQVSEKKGFSEKFIHENSTEVYLLTLFAEELYVIQIQHRH